MPHIALPPSLPEFLYVLDVVEGALRVLGALQVVEPVLPDARRVFGGRILAERVDRGRGLHVLSQIKRPRFLSRGLGFIPRTTVELAFTCNIAALPLDGLLATYSRGILWLAGWRPLRLDGAVEISYPFVRVVVVGGGGTVNLLVHVLAVLCPDCIVAQGVLIFELLGECLHCRGPIFSRQWREWQVVLSPLLVRGDRVVLLISFFG